MSGGGNVWRSCPRWLMEHCRVGPILSIRRAWARRTEGPPTDRPAGASSSWVRRRSIDSWHQQLMRSGHHHHHHHPSGCCCNSGLQLQQQQRNLYGSFAIRHCHSDNPSSECLHILYRILRGMRILYNIYSFISPSYVVAGNKWINTANRN